MGKNIAEAFKNAGKISKMGKAEKVSFIIPAHNAADTIKRVISSIERLDLDCEILVVENGSTDKTREIAEECAKKNKKIRVIVSETGVSKARNKGIKEAAGEWVVFSDADDECLVGIRILIRQIQSELDSDIDNGLIPEIIVGSYMKDNDSIIHGYKFLNRVIDNTDEVRAWMISKPTLRMQAWSKIFRTAFLRDNEIWFNEYLSYSEDSEFVIRAMIKAHRILITDTSFYLYHSGTVSAMRGVVKGRTDNYLEALEVAESDVSGESEIVKHAFVNYLITHINIVGVHDIFACEIKGKWSDRCKEMDAFMQKSVILRTIKNNRIPWNIQSMPVIMCNKRLTLFAGIIYYFRSLQNRRRYLKACYRNDKVVEN